MTAAATTPTRMSVTVPTALPMAMSDDGTVVTASDCKITNNSYGAVRVRSVSISAADGLEPHRFRRQVQPCR